MSRLNPVKGSAMRKPLSALPRKGNAPKLGSSSASKDNEYLYTAGIRDGSNRIAEYRTDSDVCPICHTDRQFNKQLRLLVSPCYHKMCESCIERLFALGPEPCPQCGRTLRKINFQHQTFEDLKVEKEVSVRRRVAEHYNKRREDFASDREYDDFLEEVEDITFNLLNDIDVEKTEARMREYTNKNSAAIATNKKKAAKELEMDAKRDEKEKTEREERRRMIEEYDEREAREAARVQAEVVQALAMGAMQRVNDIQRRAAEEKAQRAQLLEFSLPASRSNLTESETDPTTENHLPTSPSYAGPYVPFAVSDPDECVWNGWYTFKDEKKKEKYVDPRSGVRDAERNKDGKFLGGGYDIYQFWEMEVRAAVESLGIEPLA